MENSIKYFVGCHGRVEKRRCTAIAAAAVVAAAAIITVIATAKRKKKERIAEENHRCWTNNSGTSLATEETGKDVW